MYSCILLSRFSNSRRYSLKGGTQQKHADCKKSNIRTSSQGPGYVNTDMEEPVSDYATATKKVNTIVKNKAYDSSSLETGGSLSRLCNRKGVVNGHTRNATYDYDYAGIRSRNSAEGDTCGKAVQGVEGQMLDDSDNYSHLNNNKESVGVNVRTDDNYSHMATEKGIYNTTVSKDKRPNGEESYSHLGQDSNDFMYNTTTGINLRSESDGNYSHLGQKDSVYNTTLAKSSKNVDIGDTYSHLKMT